MQGFGIPAVTVILQSATKHSGVLSAFKNPHLSKFLKWSFMWGENCFWIFPLLFSFTDFLSLCRVSGKRHPEVQCSYAEVS